MKAKIQKIMMVLVVMFFSVLGMQVSANATSIVDLQNKFPNGAYWNHVVRSGHRYSGYNDVGGCNNPDGYTWTPCNTHNGNVGVGGYDCNSFSGGMQCNGFAKNWDMIFMAQPTHRGDAVLSEMQNAAMSFIIMEQEQMLPMGIGR